MPKTPTSEYVAIRLREAMKAQSMSQNELSNQSGVAQSTIGRILNCVSSPTTETLVPLAKVLGLTVAEMMGNPNISSPALVRANATRTEAERIARLTNLYAKCDDETKILILELLEKLAINRKRVRE